MSSQIAHLKSRYKIKNFNKFKTAKATNFDIIPVLGLVFFTNFEQNGSCMFCFFCRNTAIVKTEVAVADMNYSDVTAVLTAADLARFRAAFVQPS